MLHTTGVVDSTREADTMLAGTKRLLGAVVALLSSGHASGQCIVRADNLVWGACGIGSPKSCGRATMLFTVEYNEEVGGNHVSYGSGMLRQRHYMLIGKDLAYIFGAYVDKSFVFSTSPNHSTFEVLLVTHPPFLSPDFAEISNLDCCSSPLFVSRRPALQCTSTNPIATFELVAPIATDGSAYGEDAFMSGEVSDDQSSITFDLSELEPNFIDDIFDYRFTLYLDNCDTAYTWSDNFFQMSYVDDERNSIDVSRFEGRYPTIIGPDTGTCREYGAWDRAKHR